MTKINVLQDGTTFYVDLPSDEVQAFTAPRRAWEMFEADTLNMGAACRQWFETQICQDRDWEPHYKGPLG